MFSFKGEDALGGFVDALTGELAGFGGLEDGVADTVGVGEGVVAGLVGDQDDVDAGADCFKDGFGKGVLLEDCAHLHVIRDDDALKTELAAQ